MPSINRSFSQIRATAAGVPEIPKLAHGLEEREDQFQAQDLPGPEFNKDIYFVRNVQNQLEQNGIVAVSDGRFRMMSHEHIEKVRHLIGKSDEPLFFLVNLSESGKISGISSYSKKSEWLNAIEGRELRVLPKGILELKTVDKITQLACLSRILSPANTGL